MNFVEHAKEGLRNLYFSKLRSLLALIGILVGTASVVAMVLGGELATNEALKQFKSLGTDLLAVSINASGDEQTLTGKSDDITMEQALSLSTVNTRILQVAPYTQLFLPTFYNGNALNATLLGVTDQFADVVHVHLQSGRFVSLLDKYEFYGVIGHDVYDQMKKISRQEPLGQSIQIDKNIFVIVGVADSWPENNFVYANIDNAIMIPLLASTLISKYAMINNIIFRLTPESNINTVKEAITQSINQFVSGKQLNFRSAKELIAKMKKQSDILTVFLGLIGSVSLIVGGIGVMNIMLVSVVERRREIGIRLAVGARRIDISVLFLMEAVLLSLAGGFLGVLIGVLIAYFIAVLWQWDFTLFLWPPLAGFSVSVAVGIFFGFYPAYLASKLNPIEALRAE
ncbi:MAG: FtsX-like permease family protein [Gammaproteobacteria bacterium]|nr:MAG: FtsX-like permease family protein [Gammaproteobacteria bacterium]